MLFIALLVFLLFCSCIVWEDHIFENAKRDSERDCRLVMDSQLPPDQAIARLKGYRDFNNDPKARRDGVVTDLVFFKDVPTNWLRSVSVYIEYSGGKPVSCEVEGFVGSL